MLVFVSWIGAFALARAFTQRHLTGSTTNSSNRRSDQLPSSCHSAQSCPWGDIRSHEGTPIALKTSAWGASPASSPWPARPAARWPGTKTAHQPSSRRPTVSLLRGLRPYLQHPRRPARAASAPPCRPRHCLLAQSRPLRWQHCVSSTTSSPTSCTRHARPPDLPGCFSYVYLYAHSRAKPGLGAAWAAMQGGLLSMHPPPPPALFAGRPDPQRRVHVGAVQAQ
jgi:hypothetical protein